MVEPREGLRDQHDADARGDQFDRVRGGRGPLQRGPARQLLPVQRVVEGVQHDVVVEVPGEICSTAATMWSLGTTTTVVSV